MNIPITRREVLNNLIRFKDNLLEMEEVSEESERSYAILVNRHTGDIRFTRKIETLKREFPTTPKGMERSSDWGEAHLLAKDQGESVHFRFTEKLTGLDPMALGILFETL